MKIKNSQTVTVIAVMVAAAVLIKPYTRPIDELKQAADGEFPPHYKNYFDIASWTKENTPDSAVICCRKREMFYLYSAGYRTLFVNTEYGRATGLASER